ncbi:hypothetical protein [Longispora albida]|uniref:hypothetical protein n=1 Tax=Longispora albida TaxID=203523 RepID=UPI00037A1B79|nr:hypothetical protein [Longispora albida]
MRSRSGLIAGIASGVLLLLCAGGGAGAFVLVSTLEGHGAESARGAVDGFLGGVFVDQDTDKAAGLLCPELDPAIVDRGINEANSLLKKHPAAAFEWTAAEKSKERTEVVFTTSLTLAGNDGQTYSSQKLEITTVSNGGWRVCGLKRLPS